MWIYWLPIYVSIYFKIGVTKIQVQYKKSAYILMNIWHIHIVRTLYSLEHKIWDSFAWDNITDMQQVFCWLYILLKNYDNHLSWFINIDLFWFVTTKPFHFDKWKARFQLYTWDSWLSLFQSFRFLYSTQNFRTVCEQF